MGQKKHLVDGLRFQYSGMFSVEDFFKELDAWQDANGFERENKKKLEHVDAHSKKMDYIFEMWKNLADYARAVVRFRALFQDVVDFTIERKGHHRNMQKGKVLVVVDGFLEQDLEARWAQKPGYVFIKTLFDKLVWKFWMGRFDGAVAAPCYDVFNKMHDFFKRYKY